MDFMSSLSIIWFTGGILDAVFFLVALGIPVLCFQAYWVTRQKKYLFYGGGFGLISISFLLEGSAMISKLVVARTLPLAKPEELYEAIALGRSLQLGADLFFVVGLTFLLLVYLDLLDKKGALPVLLLTGFASVLAFGNLIASELLEIGLLIGIVIALAQRYKKNRRIGLTLLGFILILIAESSMIPLLLALPLFGFPWPDHGYFLSNLILLTGLIALNLSFLQVLHPWRKGPTST